MGNLRRAILTFCKAQVSAQIATIADFAMTVVLAELCGVWYLIATFVGALTGGIINCIINYQWVFHAAGLKKRFVAIKYLLVWCGSIALNTGGTYLITELKVVHFLIAKTVVAIAVGFLWNYQMQRLFVYRDLHLYNMDKKKKDIEQHELP